LGFNTFLQHCWDRLRGSGSLRLSGWFAAVHQAADLHELWIHLLNPRKWLHANATTAVRPKSLPPRSTESTISFRVPSRARFRLPETTAPMSILQWKKRSTRRPLLPPLLPPLFWKPHASNTKPAESRFSLPTSEQRGRATPAPCTPIMRLRNQPLPP